MTTDAQPPIIRSVEKPRLRGVLHQAAFSVSLVIGTLLIVYSDPGRQRFAAVCRNAAQTARP